MENEKKLIYAEDLFTVLRDDINISGANLARIKRHIEEAQAVDAVEVVRCKDCKHFAPCEEITGVSWTGFCNYGEFHTDEDDFCSRGERREGE